MSKVKIIDRRSEFSIFNEKELLSKMNHPFIVNMYFSFQDFSNLYLVLDYLTGGDLRYHISICQRFNEKETKFFISNIILGLEYIHSKNIIHRDIKPENLVLDKKGYLRITDFGVAKINLKDNSSETSGTPGYMAPEVLFVLNHSFPADFFALGVIGFEFMMGFRPYVGRNRKEIKDVILNTQAKISMNKIPYGWGKDSVDFINRLLERKVKNRLGSKKGICELKEHKWFKDVDWEVLKLKKIKAPFIPKGEDNFNRNYCEAIDIISNETIERYREYMNDDNYNILFNNYTFSNIENLKLIAEENNKKNNFNDNIDKLKTYNKENINKNIILDNKENNKEENKILKKSNGLTNILSLSSTNFLIKSNRNNIINNINNNINKMDFSNNKNNKKNNKKNSSENKKNQNSETISIKSINLNNNNNNALTSKKNNTINIENNSLKTNNIQKDISEEIKVPSSNKLINRTFSLNDFNNKNNNKLKTFCLEKKYNNKLNNDFNINNINYFIGEEYKKFNNNNNNNNKIKLILSKSNSMKIIDDNLEKIFLKKKLFKNENSSNIKLFQNIENNINSNQKIFQSILNNQNNKKYNHNNKKNFFIGNREKTYFNNSNISNDTFQNKIMLLANNNDGFISNRNINHNNNKKIIINPILNNNNKHNFPQIPTSNKNNNNLSIIERTKQLEKIKSSLLRLKSNNNYNILSFKHNKKNPNSFSDISIKKNKNIDNKIFKRSLSKENFINNKINDGFNNNMNKNFKPEVKIKILFQNNNLLNKRKESKDYTNFLSI